MRKKTFRYTTSCDMGSVKIFSADVSFYFNNGIGDVPTKVSISSKSGGAKEHVNDVFEGHFTVKNPATVFLSDYDCGDNPIHQFPIGRWFVWRNPKRAELYIEYCDGDLHA